MLYVLRQGQNNKRTQDLDSKSEVDPELGFQNTFLVNLELRIKQYNLR